MRKFHKRYAYMVDVLADFMNIKDSKVVDCGCGLGDGSVHFANMGGSVVGVDLDQAKILMAKKVFRQIRFICGNIMSIDLPDNFADLFICSETLEHLTRHQSIKAVSEILRVSKSKSYICITVPDQKKTCLKNPNHRQYLSVQDITECFSSCKLVSNSVFYKNTKKLNRGNRVLVFERS